ncbi:unnamed protein product [Danaus chrysippus]|uniref:(African queen) hypothetical protein n=1 Tax=Danaus chrysippus TaxID=151541 RepID=A0A8J2QRE0_9NEOP|nr:unnamed protein product [Danaus chrysippus]
MAQNSCAKGAHSRERTSGRPPLGRAAALPHGAKSPDCERELARPRHARDPPATSAASSTREVHVSHPTVRLPTSTPVTSHNTRAPPTQTYTDTAFNYV